MGNGPAIKGHIGHEALESQLQENLEKDQGRWLLSHQPGDFRRSFRRINALNQQELSQSWFMQFYPVNIVKNSLLHFIIVLILDTNSAIIIKLAPEVQVVSFFYPEIIASCESV
jgi:hypothetical protein